LADGRIAVVRDGPAMVIGWIDWLSSSAMCPRSLAPLWTVAVPVTSLLLGPTVEAGYGMFIQSGVIIGAVMPGDGDVER